MSFICISKFIKVIGMALGPKNIGKDEGWDKLKKYLEKALLKVIKLVGKEKIIKKIEEKIDHEISNTGLIFPLHRVERKKDNYLVNIADKFGVETGPLYEAIYAIYSTEDLTLTEEQKISYKDVSLKAKEIFSTHKNEIYDMIQSIYAPIFKNISDLYKKSGWKIVEINLNKSKNLESGSFTDGGYYFIVSLKVNLGK